IGGFVHLTPIQHWFFEQELTEPQHWNQSVFLAITDPRIDLAVLEHGLSSLLEHHSALSLRFRRGEQGWQQESVDVQAYDLRVPDILRSVDIAFLSAADQRRVIE